jgi:hypothetical protein
VLAHALGVVDQAQPPRCGRVDGRDRARALRGVACTLRTGSSAGRRLRAVPMCGCHRRHRHIRPRPARPRSPGRSPRISGSCSPP